LERVNRFVAAVELDGDRELAHIANTGRLEQLLIPGYRVWVFRAANPKRETPYDLALVELATGLASANSNLPPALLQEAFERGKLPTFSAYTNVRREVEYGDSRIDLEFTGEESTSCLAEVKSITLVRNRVGLFPDAPTARGRRHIETLMQARREGMDAAAVFVVQRGDADSVAPNHLIDPDFSRMLRRAHDLGVRMLAYRVEFTSSDAALGAQIPVDVLNREELASI
jgi:sugar fermentation stimulation protein A